MNSIIHEPDQIYIRTHLIPGFGKCRAKQTWSTLYEVLGCWSWALDNSSFLPNLELNEQCFRTRWWKNWAKYQHKLSSGWITNASCVRSSYICKSIYMYLTCRVLFLVGSCKHGRVVKPFKHENSIFQKSFSFIGNSRNARTEKTSSPKHWNRQISQSCMNMS